MLVGAQSEELVVFLHGVQSAAEQSEDTLGRVGVVSTKTTLHERKTSIWENVGAGGIACYSGAQNGVGTLQLPMLHQFLVEIEAGPVREGKAGGHQVEERVHLALYSLLMRLRNNSSTMWSSPSSSSSALRQLNDYTSDCPLLFRMCTIRN